MNRKSAEAAVGSTLVLGHLFGCGVDTGTEGGVATRPQVDELGISLSADPVPGSYIIEFEAMSEPRVAADRAPQPASRVARSAAETVLRENGLSGVRIDHVFDAAVSGFSARMTREQAGVLARDPRIKRVAQDGWAHSSGQRVGVEWAVDRLDSKSLPVDGAFRFDAAGTGAGVHIYSISGGARGTHAQFEGRLLCGAAQSPSLIGGVACQAGPSTLDAGVNLATKALYTPSPEAVTGAKIVVKTYLGPGGSGDADLYVKKGARPTTSSYDCRAAGATSTETCDLSAKGAGTYYVLVLGYTAVRSLTVERYDACATSSYGDACAAANYGDHNTAALSAAGGKDYGVAHGATLHAVRSMANDGTGTVADNLAAFNWVLSNHVDPAVVVWPVTTLVDTTLSAAIRNVSAHGILVVGAAGNAGTSASSTLPGANADALVVGATDAADAVWPSSNYGSAVDLMAPGVSVRVAVADSDTASGLGTGTSFSAPLVAGIAAQYLQKNPSATAASVRAALLSGAVFGKITGNLNGSPNLLAQSILTTTCGDGCCYGAETCSSCVPDCGTCTCGDGRCGDGETCSSCPSDCGTCGCPGDACTTFPVTGVTVAGADGLRHIGTKACNNPTITVSGATQGDPDLYVRAGAWPSSTSYDCRPYLSRTGPETCAMRSGNVQYHISVDAYGSTSATPLTISVVCN